MSKEIVLTQGFVAVVDDEDFLWLSQYNWCILKLPHNNYAKRTNKAILMHREIMGKLNPDIGELQIDHINHNGLDNRKENLRICTSRQNAGNQRKTRGSSKYKGVHLEKQTGEWRASIGINGKNKKSPRFTFEWQAAEWYNYEAKKQFGEFALLNVIEYV